MRLIVRSLPNISQPILKAILKHLNLKQTGYFEPPAAWEENSNFYGIKKIKPNKQNPPVVLPPFLPSALKSPSFHMTYFRSSSLMSSSLLMLGNFSCRSFFTPLLMPTGTTFRLLQGRGRIGEVLTVHVWVSHPVTIKMSASVRLLWTLSLNSHV